MESLDAQRINPDFSPVQGIFPSSLPLAKFQALRQKKNINYGGGTEGSQYKTDGNDCVVVAAETLTDYKIVLPCSVFNFSESKCTKQKPTEA